MPGRQRWVGTRRNRSAKLLTGVTEKYLTDLSEGQLANPDNEHAEAFFRKIGFDSVDSIDFSDSESASIIQYLSSEIDPDLINRFDVICEGGTFEHFF